jgi:hypothetical protein
MNDRNPRVDDMLACANPLMRAVARLDVDRAVNIPIMFSMLLNDLPLEERVHVMFFLHYSMMKTMH